MTRRIRFGIFIAAAMTLLAGCGDGGDETVDSTPSAPSTDPGDGSVTATGYVDDHFGFGIGFADTWKPNGGEPFVVPNGGAIVLGTDVSTFSIGGRGWVEPADGYSFSEMLLFLVRGQSHLTIRYEEQKTKFGDQVLETPEAFLNDNVLKYHSYGDTWTVPNGVQQVTIDGQVLSRVDSRGTFGPGRSADTAHLAYFDRGYAVVFAYVAVNSTDKAELEAIIQNIDFH